jgi:TfoX/Sxy family transcriptional regulator of competence genes
VAYDEGLAERLREALGEYPGIGEKRMFGGICFLSRDYMFLGIADDSLMVRVGPDAYEAALARPHAREMDFTGKPMKGYVFVAPEGFGDDTALAWWIEQAHGFVQTLPAKKPKGEQHDTRRRNR